MDVQETFGRATVLVSHHRWKERGRHGQRQYESPTKPKLLMNEEVGLVFEAFSSPDRLKRTVRVTTRIRELLGDHPLTRPTTLHPRFRSYFRPTPYLCPLVRVEVPSSVCSYPETLLCLTYRGTQTKDEWCDLVRREEDRSRRRRRRLR